MDEEESPPASRPSSGGRRYLSEGRHVSKGGVVAADPDIHRKSPQRLGGVVFCGECGEPNKSGVLYCSCGEPLAEDDDYSSPTQRPPPARERLSPARNRNSGGDVRQNMGADDAGDTSTYEAASVSPGAGNEDAGKAMLQRHRGAPKIPAASSSGGGQGGWKLMPEPKDESEDEEVSPRGRERVRERERERAQQMREQAARYRFQGDSGGVGADGRGDDDGDDNDGGTRNGGAVGVGTERTGATAESRGSSAAGEEAQVVVRGDAARRHRRAPLDKTGVSSDAAMRAEEGEGGLEGTGKADSTKIKALEEADEMMMMFAPPKRSAQPSSLTRKEGPAQSASGAPDSFLTTLGMPKTIPEGRWGEGDEENHDEDRSPGVGSKGVDRAMARKNGASFLGYERQEKDTAKNDIFGQGTQVLLQDKKHMAQEQHAHKENSKMISQTGGGGHQRARGAAQDLDTSFETQADTIVTKVSTMSAAVMDPAVIRALREAKALLDDGVLTEDEFKHQKRIILQGGANPFGIQQPPATRDGSILAYDEGTPYRMPGHGTQSPRTGTSESQFTARPQVDTADSSEHHRGVRWVADGQGGRRAQWAPRVDKSGLVVPVKEGPPMIQMKPIRPTSSSTAMSRDEGDLHLRDGGAQVLTVEALERHQAAEAARAAAAGASHDGGGPRDAQDHEHELLDTTDPSHQRGEHKQSMPAAPRRGKGKMLADPQGAFIPESQPHVAAGAVVDDTPLFMRDHNEEVERLRREAEQELESAELAALAEPELEHLDAQGLRNAMAQRRHDPNTGAPSRPAIDSQFDDDDQMVVTDGAIRDAWRQRENQILQTLSDPVPSWGDLPRGCVQSVESILVQRQVKPLPSLLVELSCEAQAATRCTSILGCSLVV